MGTLIYSDGRVHDFHSTKVPPGKCSLSIGDIPHTRYLTYLKYNTLGIKEYKCTFYRKHTLENLILIFFLKFINTQGALLWKEL